MAWVNPKTDWKAGDAPNAGDFNRIEENINYVLDEAGKVNTVNNKAPDANKNIQLVPADIGAVPTTRTINGKALSSNIVLTGADIAPAEGTLILYVNASTGNDNNSGTSESAPFKTFNKAVSVAASKIYQRIKIHLAAGTYVWVDVSTIRSQYIGIDGDYDNPAGVIFSNGLDIDETSAYIKIMYCKFNVASRVTGPVNILECQTVTFVGGLQNDGMINRLELSSCTVSSATAFAVKLGPVGWLYMNGGSYSSTSYGLLLDYVARAYLYNLTLNVTSTNSSYAGVDINCSTVYAENIKGSVGSAKKFVADKGTILFDISNSFSGATSEATKGSQIFTAPS
jgi:hypothetical protein